MSHSISSVTIKNLNNNQEQKQAKINLDFKANDFKKNPMHDSLELNDSHSKNDSTNKWLIGIGAVLATAGIAYFGGKAGLLGEAWQSKMKNLFKSGKKDISEPQNIQVTPQKSKTELKPTKESDKIYKEIDKKLHAKTEINAETIDKNLEPIKKTNSWSKEDMQNYYKDLEKFSNKYENLLSIDVKTVKEDNLSSLADQYYNEKDKIGKELGEERFFTILKLLRNDYSVKDINIDSLTPKERVCYELGMIADKLREQREKNMSEFMEKLFEGNKEIQTKHSSEYLESYELYSLSDYYDLDCFNRELRSGEMPCGTLTIDEAFAKAPPLGNDGVVYRAVCKNAGYAEDSAFIDSIKEGLTIKDPAFVSTSINTSNPQFLQFARHAYYNDGIIMRIKLPKGTQGILGGYDEFLLPRNTQIKINKIETINGHKIADCEYILPK